MADHKQGPFEEKVARLEAIAKELEGGNVDEIIVALTRVVMEPAHDLEQLRRRDDDCRLPPHDLDTVHGPAESLLEHGSAWIRRSAALRHRLRCCRSRGVARQCAARDDGREARAHSPERV